MTRVSVITPTIGRPSLETMLRSLVPQLAKGDEAIILGDGPQPEAKNMVARMKSGLVTYVETEAVHNFGNPQRNHAARLAKGDRLFFVDDDDVVMPGAIAAIKARARKAPGALLMFRMQHPSVVIWNERKVCPGNVSGQMFVPRNVPERLGTWSGRYEADQDFISSTLALYPDVEKAIMWCPEILVIQGLAGKNGAGGIEL